MESLQSAGPQFACPERPMNFVAFLSFVEERVQLALNHEVAASRIELKTTPTRTWDVTVR